MRKHFAIVGAGIGGLTMAIALQRRGCHVTVFEAAPEIKPLGAGLGLAANAVKAFDKIGIANDVLRVGNVIKKVSIRNPSGDRLTVTDSEKISAKYGIINNFTIHRADLHRVLLDQLTPGTVVLNKNCTGFEQSSQQVVLYFKDGSESAADYVIACDGIHSVFRKKLVPESEPRYAGYTCWRGVVENLPADFNPDETTETWGQGCRFGIVPLTNNRAYWFACVNAKQNDPLMKSFRIPELLTWFSTFHQPIPELLRRTPHDKLIWSDIIDIKPIKQFAFGNIVLMGDAAHATTPNMGQGACMAIEDAAVLAHCIGSSATGDEAFRKFEAKRIERTTRIVNASWTLGRAAQLENPLLIGLRNALVRLTPPRVAEKQVRFLYDVSFH